MWAFSFCLYGPPSQKYYTGLLQNLKSIQDHYPDWVVFVYVGLDVPPEFAKRLMAHPQVRLRTTGKTGPILMMYRFLAIDEPNIEGMMVRDADSRIHYRDRWAIQQFRASVYQAHVIRDHPWHTTALMGGLWGIKRGFVASIGELVGPRLEEPWAHGLDQIFLAQTLYPLVKGSLLVHTSQPTLRYSEEEVHASFPWAWSEALYCGKVELGGLLSIFAR